VAAKATVDKSKDARNNFIVLSLFIKMPKGLTKSSKAG